ncbi:MAG: esterase-like activity of phytase family protein [Phycisphaerales bacterium]
MPSAVAILASACATVAGGASFEVSDPGQAPVPLAARGFGAEELSGIAWVGTGRFLLVGDGGQQAVWDAWIDIDPSTGRILAQSITARVPVPGLGTDVEGIAIDRAAGTFLAADEASAAIRRFDLVTFAACGSLRIPPIFAPPNMRPNFGFEALGCLRGEAWTANEEALVSDGPVSGTQAGAWVRLQRFDAQGFPVGQWAYRCDPISGMTDLVDVERSGVVDLVPWDRHTVLVLEREFGGSVIPDFRSRLYAVDLSAATDVSNVQMLAAGGFVPAAKTLLWQRGFPFSNFEGMALGPPLVGGRRSLILVSDDGGGVGGQNQRLLALAVRAVREAPCDLDGSGTVDGIDLGILLSGWGPALDPHAADVNQDCAVDGLDLGALLASWGPVG